MAAKVKAILVGAYEGNKVYYLLQPYGERKFDGAVLSGDGQIDFVKFFHFITTTPQIQELQFSKFHKFLWSPGASSEEREKWNRIFLKKTQPISDDMLIGAKIITSLGEEPIKRKDYRIRADEFRRKIASTGLPQMDKTVLSRKSLFNMRGIVGFKALGPLVGGRPSVDGDGDGFVDDGLPTMRPFIPGFDFIPDNIAAPSLRSITTRRADKAADRSATRDELLDAVENVADIVARRHNGGKRINTRKDAMDVLTRLIPSFGLQPGDKGRSSIAFLDSMTGYDTVLSPWESAYLNQFLFMIGDDPGRNDVTWELKPMSQRFVQQGAGGYTSVPKGIKDYELSQKFSDEGPRLVPKKVRKQKMTIGYSAETDEQNSRLLLLGWLFKQDKRNYNALSYAISKALRDDLAQEPNQAQILKALEYKYGLDIESGVDTISSAITSLLQQNNSLGQESNIPTAALPQEIIQAAWNGIVNSANAIAKVDPSFDENLLLSKAQKAIQQGSIADLLKSLRKTKEAYIKSLDAPTLKNNLAAGERLLDKWLPINSKLVGVHESTHALQNLRISENVRKRAQKLRDEYLERYIERQKQAGLSAESFKELQKQLPIEAFYPDVYKEELSEYAAATPELFRRDLLMLATGGTAGSVIADFGKTNGTSGLLVQQTAMLASAMQLLNNPLPGIHKYDAAEVMGIVGPIDIQEIIDANPGVSSLTEMSKIIDKVKTEKIDALIEKMKSWMGQPLFLGNEPVVMNQYIANLLNQMQSNISEVPELLGLSTLREFKAGDSITPAIASVLINPSIMQREQSSRRNVMRGIRMFDIGENDSLVVGKTPPTVILSTLGFPDIKGDDGSIIDGGRPEDMKPLVDALIAASPLIRETSTQMALGVQNLENIVGTRSEPDSVDLPSSFGDISFSDFMNMSSDELLEGLFSGLDESLEDISNQIKSGNMPSRFWEIFEMLPKTGRTELAPLNASEIKLINEIARKIGLPAGVPSSSSGTGLSSLPAQGYSSYQATLVDPITWLGSTKWSIVEFIAESAVADFMGIPFSQIADSGLNTRELTNEELQVLNKLMQWVFSGRLPSDRVSEVFNP